MSCVHVWIRHSRARIEITRAGVVPHVREWSECDNCGERKGAA